MMRLMSAVAVAFVMAGLSVAAAETCFFDREHTEGMNKLCFYKCVSGPAAITVSAVALCPLTLQR